MTTGTLEQRLSTVEQSLSELRNTVLKITPVKKDWRQVAGKLRDTTLAREVDLRGREYREQWQLSGDEGCQNPNWHDGFENRLHCSRT
ncbi:hypothetical protein [Prosthecobacter sp.]|uniref:hypothetical protein n=1 Tax=Prosthecobacter sp. TaxID=1965333 RepID=UPI0024897A2F|nr:hypothetical protein [Prosthecobacter sp.]MDI1311300.1 hypothetical protein [Prosthecobacter sp.]